MIGKRFGMYMLHSQRPYNNRIPEGLILPYQGGVTAPTGWDLYTAANDLYIVGAGDTYSANETDATHNDIIYTTNSPAHPNKPNFAVGSDAADGSDLIKGTDDDDKNTGTHTVTVAGFEPGTEQLVFIKSQAGSTKYPKDALVLGIQDFAGLSVVKDNARLLKAGATITSVATQTASGSVNSSYAANHDHRHNDGFNRFPGGTSAHIYAAAGSHRHAITLNLTAQIKRYYLSAWTNASAAFKNVEGIIGMYESTTPPVGWFLCDGNSGTPDLRDHFIQLDSAANDNQSAGDNTVKGVLDTCSSAGAHTHQGASETGNSTVDKMHGTCSNHSNHTIATEDIDFIPPYYALAFIMRG